MAKQVLSIILTTLSLLILLIAPTNAAKLSLNTLNNIQINSQKDLADMLLAHFGMNTADVSQNIKKYIEANKLSVLNAVEDIALLVVDKVEGTDANSGFTITQNFGKMLGEHAKKINAHFMNGKTQQQITSYISQKLSNKINHKISISSSQLKTLKTLLAPIASSSRILEQTDVIIAPVPTQTEPSVSYITKFFFIIFFILILIAGISAIACMENKKDSLLYAKFIADVGR